MKQKFNQLAVSKAHENAATATPHGPRVSATARAALEARAAAAAAGAAGGADGGEKKVRGHRRR